MYTITDYDLDCKAGFDRTKTEVDRVSGIVEEGRYYENGFFTLFKSG